MRSVQTLFCILRQRRISVMLAFALLPGLFEVDICEDLFHYRQMTMYAVYWKDGTITSVKWTIEYYEKCSESILHITFTMHIRAVSIRPFTRLLWSRYLWRFITFRTNDKVLCTLERRNNYFWKVNNRILWEVFRICSAYYVRDAYPCC